MRYDNEYIIILIIKQAELKYIFEKQKIIDSIVKFVDPYN